jgi:flagellar hook-length control protein FliK
MAVISSSQKLANTQPPRLSASQKDSSEAEGLFASLFGGVVLDDKQPDASVDASPVTEAGQLPSGEGEAEREDVAGVVIVRDGETPEIEEDMQAAMLAELGETAIAASGADENSENDVPENGVSEQDAQTRMPSLLAEAQRAEAPDEAVTNIAGRPAQIKMVADQPETRLAGNITIDRQASRARPQGEQSGQILPEARKLADYATQKPDDTGINTRMVKKDSHITATSDAKADARADAKQTVEMLDAGELKSARMSMMTSEQLNRITPKLVAGEALDKVLDTAPRAVTSEPANAQIAATNTASSGGQSSHQGMQGQAQQTLAGSSMSDTIADMLDMMEDNWADTLVRRIERAMGQKSEGIDIELNPRNLGRLRVNLNLVNDQTHIHMKAESATAAQMIGDAESRLAQMLEQSGMKLAQFSSQSGLGGDQNANSQSQKQGGQNRQVAEGNIAEIEDDNISEQLYASENKVNLKA